MDRELFRNGSGYADPTAYKAMITMEEKNMEVRPYEIWRYTVGENEKIGVVMAHYDAVIAVMPLFEKSFLGCVQVSTLQGPRYVHPIKMTYVLESRLVEYVQDVPEAAVNDIMNLFHWCYSEIIPKADVHAANSFGPCDLGEPGPILPPGNVEYPDNTELQIRLEGERREKEVYKGMYEILLDKLIK